MEQHLLELKQQRNQFKQYVENANLFEGYPIKPVLARVRADEEKRLNHLHSLISPDACKDSAGFGDLVKKAELEDVDDICNVIGERLGFPAVFSGILIGQGDQASLGLSDEMRAMFEPLVDSLGLDELPRNQRDFRLVIPEGICPHALAHFDAKQPDAIFQLPNLADEETIQKIGYRGMNGSYAGVPITLGEDMIGTFCLVDEMPRTLTERESNIMKLMSRVISNRLRTSLVLMRLRQSDWGSSLSLSGFQDLLADLHEPEVDSLCPSAKYFPQMVKMFDKTSSHGDPTVPPLFAFSTLPNSEQQRVHAFEALQLPLLLNESKTARARAFRCLLELLNLLMQDPGVDESQFTNYYLNLLDDAKQVSVAMAGAKPHPPQVMTHKYSICSGYVKEVQSAETESERYSPLHIPNFSEDPSLSRLDNAPVDSYLGVPLWVPNVNEDGGAQFPVGTICALHSKSGNKPQHNLSPSKSKVMKMISKLMTKTVLQYRMLHDVLEGMQARLDRAAHEDEDDKQSDVKMVVQPTQAQAAAALPMINFPWLYRLLHYLCVVVTGNSVVRLVSLPEKSVGLLPLSSSRPLPSHRCQHLTKGALLVVTALLLAVLLLTDLPQSVLLGWISLLQLVVYAACNHLYLKKYSKLPHFWTLIHGVMNSSLGLTEEFNAKVMNGVRRASTVFGAIVVLALGCVIFFLVQFSVLDHSVLEAVGMILLSLVGLLVVSNCVVPAYMFYLLNLIHEGQANSFEYVAVNVLIGMGQQERRTQMNDVLAKHQTPSTVDDAQDGMDASLLAENKDKLVELVQSFRRVTNSLRETRLAWGGHIALATVLGLLNIGINCFTVVSVIVDYELETQIASLIGTFSVVSFIFNVAVVVALLMSGVNMSRTIKKVVYQLVNYIAGAQRGFSILGVDIITLLRLVVSAGGGALVAVVQAIVKYVDGM